MHGGIFVASTNFVKSVIMFNRILYPNAPIAQKNGVITVDLYQNTACGE